MKIALVSNFTKPYDEGMKKVGFSYYFTMKRRNIEVLPIHPRQLISNVFFLKKYNPDIIHYVPGPSILSLILLRIIKKFFRNPKCVVTFTHPQYLFSFKLVKLFKPDLALAQSKDIFQKLNKNKIKSKYFPNGVDTSKFKIH